MDDRFFLDFARISQHACWFDLGSKDERVRSGRLLTELFSELTDSLDITGFVEIGAFEASTSLGFKRRNPEARVVAVEANPANYEHFCANMDFQKAGVEYVHAAVSDQDGFVDFQLQKERGGSTVDPIAANNSMHRRSESDVEYEVYRAPAVRLDTLAGRYGLQGRRLALWIDCEGSAREVLAGGTETLGQVDVLHIEVEEHAYWEGQWLFPAVHSHLTACGLTSVARDFEDRDQFNVLFLSRPAFDTIICRRALTAYWSKLATHRRQPAAE